MNTLSSSTESDKGNRVWPRGWFRQLPVDAGWALLLIVGAGFFMMPGMDGRADGDFWWHLLYGQWFLEHGRIAESDWLSWTKYGSPYKVTQWLGQVLIASAWSVADWKGTAILTWAATALVVVSAYMSAKRELNATLTSAVLALSMTTSYWSSYARPQIFGFVCMGALMLLIESSRNKKPSVGTAIKVGLIMCVWANLHGSFVIGIVYIAISVFSEISEGCFEKHSKAESLKRTKWLLMLLGLGCIATAINPYGLGAWQYVAEISQLQTTKIGVVLEWTPTDLSTSNGSTFVLISLAILIVWGIGEAKPKVRDVAMLVCMFLFGMMAVRQTAFATIAMIPIAARALNGQKITAAVSNALPNKFGWLVWLPGLCISIIVGQSQNSWRNRGIEQWQRQVFPVEATEFLNKHDLKGRLFNEATAGGWMEFHGKNKTFIDGRLDLHRDFEYFDWFFTRQGAPDWEERLRRTDPEIFVIQTQSPLTSLLMATRKAAVVYADDRYTVLLKRDSKFAEVISKMEVKKVPFEIFGSSGEVKPSLCGW